MGEEIMKEVLNRIQELDLSPEEKILEAKHTLRRIEAKEVEKRRLRVSRRAKVEELRVSREILENCEERLKPDLGRKVQHYPDMEAALDMIWLSEFEASEEERLRIELREPEKEVVKDRLTRITGE
jgi:hypothetical protein